MRYYSLKRKSPDVSFQEAVLNGLARDRSLYFPESISILPKKFFENIREKKYIFDLRAFVNEEVSKQNIKSIENIEKDTFSEEELFYSYRRSCQNSEKDYGRCISVILMT